MNPVRAFFNRTFTLGQCLAWLGMALALAVLGAHFYRAGEYGMVLCVGGALFFSGAQSGWKPYAVALFLLWGMLEWGFSAQYLAVVRAQMGMPWLRGAGILLAVGLLTGLAGAYGMARARRVNRMPQEPRASGMTSPWEPQASGTPREPQANGILREQPVNEAALAPQGKGTAWPQQVGGTAQTQPVNETLRASEMSRSQQANEASLAPQASEPSQPSRLNQTSRHPALLQGIVFICTFLALFYLQQGAPMRFLLLERYLPALGSVQIFFAAWYAAFVAGRLANPRLALKTRRIVWLVFACVFFGQFFLGLLGLDRMLLTGSLHAPIPAFIVFAPVFRHAPGMMPFIILIATLLAGGAWCSMLCYFGPFDALAAGSRPVRPLPEFMKRLFTYGRPVILIVGCLAALGLRAAGISPAATVAVIVAYAALSLSIMAVLSRRYHSMMHCGAFCPIGLLVNAVSRLSPWRMRVNRQTCTNCGACEAVCRYRAITSASRAAGKTLPRCSLCRDCVAVCAKGAVNIHCPGLSGGLAAKVFTGVLSVLHALFLSIAMV